MGIATESFTAQHEEQIISDAMSYFGLLLSDIQRAKRCIDLEVYIFQFDHLGVRVADALIEAAQRGVAVRILVDGIGTPNWEATFARKLERAGISTHIFHPFPWAFRSWGRSIARWPLLLRWLYLLFKVNSRNHRKICMIDETIVYVGSFNISKNHLDVEQGGEGWRDMAIRLSNPHAIQDLQEAFESAWNHRSIHERLRDSFRRVKKNPLFRLNNSRHRRRILYKNLLKSIKNSQRRIWITNAYFVPDHFLLSVLKDAARRGVDVRILLPGKSDVFIMPWAASMFYRRLLQAGVRIFEYSRAILHAKILIIDDWMLVGSSNLNHRSLLHDLEVDVHVGAVHAKQNLENFFLQDLLYSHEVSLDQWRKRSLRQRLLGGLVLYIKYWL